MSHAIPMRPTGFFIVLDSTASGHKLDGHVDGADGFGPHS